MKLGIDIDGTIKQTQKAAIKVYNEEFNMNVKEDEVETFYLDEPYGLTDEEGRKMWRKLESKIYTIGIPLDHAAEVLQEFSKEGNEIFYITARPGFKKVKAITVEWLEKHGFPYNGENLYMNAQKKGKVASDLGIDLFFEDDPEHLDNLIAAGIKTIIVDRKYNRDYDDVPRIYDWLEAKELVNKLEQDIKNTNSRS